MQLEEALKHLVAHLEIYRYVGSDDVRTPDEIKEYMMNELERPESIARSNMNALMNGNAGALLESDGEFYIDFEKSQELEDLLEAIFKWSEFDRRYKEQKNLRSDRDDYCRWWQQEENEKIQLQKQWEKERNDFKDVIRDLEMKNRELQMKIFDQKFEQNTLMLSSVEIGPEDVGFYKDSQFPFKDRHPMINERTMQMESYLKEIPTDDPITDDPHIVDLAGSSLAAVNMRMHQISQVFSENIMELLIKRVGPFRERYLHLHPQINVLSIEKLLKMTDLTNAERLALYTVYCDDMSEEKRNS